MTNEIAVGFDELGRGEKWRFMWGYVWRNAVAGIASAVAGGIAGAMLGFVIGIVAHGLGKNVHEIEPLLRGIGLLAGIPIGLITLWQLVRWLFMVNWFGYRLRLVKDASAGS